MVANPVSKSSIEVVSGASKAVAADYAGGDYTFAVIPRGIHVNSDGDAVVILENDTTAVTLSLIGGGTYAYRIKTIKNSGTTADMGITGLY